MDVSIEKSILEILLMAGREPSISSLFHPFNMLSLKLRPDIILFRVPPKVEATQV